MDQNYRLIIMQVVNTAVSSFLRIINIAVIVGKREESEHMTSQMKFLNKYHFLYIAYLNQTPVCFISGLDYYLSFLKVYLRPFWEGI